jgi:hypothetical protein
MMADTMDTSPDEVNEVNRICREYFMQEAASPQQAEQMMAGLVKITKDKGVKLVHLGNTVFLVIVKGKGLVEVHTMTTEEDSVSLARNFVQLAAYLKNIGVKTAYTYADDPKFALVAKRTRLPFETKEVQYPGTEATTTAYYLTF